MNKLVLVESPYRGRNYESLPLNLAYGRACLRDCFMRGEFPFASHLLYTQDGVLSDKNPGERELGIGAGLAWGSKAELTAVYFDLVDDWEFFVGMARGVQTARRANRPVEFRNLPDENLVRLDPSIIAKRKNSLILQEELEEFIRIKNL